MSFHRLHQDHKQFSPDALHVVTVITNPRRFRSRYNLFKNFEKMVSDAGARLWVVEVAFGDRPHEITNHANQQHIQLRTNSEIWHKENLINIGISRLPADWKYVAWVDADVQFVRPDWAVETVHMLQHHQIVQMFSLAMDMNPEMHPFQAHKGFAWSYVTGKNPLKLTSERGRYGYPYGHWHPGYAWAARREAVDHLGGLMDWAILGAADHHMAHALIGNVEATFPDWTSALQSPYRTLAMEWQRRAERHVRRDIGYVDGTINHYWHGTKANRRYGERWSIIIDNKYNPETDLKKDWQGLYQLTDRSIALRDQIRAYFRARNEDSIDFDPSEDAIQL